jgi:hypothetical protein
MHDSVHSMRRSLYESSVVSRVKVSLKIQTDGATFDFCNRMGTLLTFSASQFASALEAISDMKRSITKDRRNVLVAAKLKCQH